MFNCIRVHALCWLCLYVNTTISIVSTKYDFYCLLQDNFQEVDEEFMFAKSADPATMEEVQVLLEDSVKGLSFDVLVQRKLTQPLMCQTQD